ncbi:multidrug transporter [Microbacterium terricola]|uniref:Multidrug transporter n=1 Tax=Microbacterium terricola TaxID=344163 RepID=A0ABM8DVG7_9MICO|nr:multidrug transporter [Microbacterium terricola]
MAAVVVSVVLWSTAYGLSALVLVTASPAVLSELRLLLAVPLLVAMVIVRRAPDRGLCALGAALRRPRTVLLALTGVALFYLPSNLGLALSSAGTAALMSASLPVLTALLAWGMLRERVTGRVAAGLALTTCGIVLASARAAQFGLGAVLLVAGLASYALYTVLLRRLAPPQGGAQRTAGGAAPDPLVLATATAIWGALLLTPWVAVELVAGTAAWPTGTTGWVSILILALVVTGPTMALYNYGAERVPAAFSGTAAAAVPVLGYAFAVVLGEPLEPLKVAGGTLALAGIVLAAMPARASAPVVVSAS